jgi:heterodisulfide reductase subunit A
VGVFICECGSNIKEAIDMEDLVHFTGQLDPVVLSEPVGLLCTPDAMASVAEKIRHHKIDRVVFAGCTASEHERDFHEIGIAAGLNPFLTQLANIREQCAWVIPDRRQATEKAKALVRGAVYRVCHHHPLHAREIDGCPDVLIVGGGVAGISAAKTLVQKGRRVFLVERSACIGGKVMLYEDLFPDLACAACLLEGDLDAVLHDDRIEVFTLSEVSAIRGYPGNFGITIQQQPRFIDSDRCIGCSDCMNACPVEIPNEVNNGWDHRTAVSIPYPGALPHTAVIDAKHCLRFKDVPCTACKDACNWGAVDYEQSVVKHELDVGAVVVATGFDLFNPNRAAPYGYPTLDNVITAFTFERLVNTTGPTKGNIVLPDGRSPSSVAFIHCVGSRIDAFNTYCSAVCCLHSFKHARQLKKQLPETEIHHFLADLCLPGKGAQRLFDQLRSKEEITLHRMARPDAVRIDQKKGRTIIEYETPTGEKSRIEAQLVVLATGMEPAAGTRQLAQTLSLRLDEDGFFQEAHSIHAGVDSTVDGIHLAGCCQDPKDIPSAIAQGQAAAGRILQKLTPGQKIVLEPIVARVDPELCSGCGTCLASCPFNAISQLPEELALTIEETMCHGCGICAAACPSGAITLCHFSRSAVCAELNGLLAADGEMQ